MCGFAENSGQRLWCATAGDHPAYSGGVLAYAARGGTVRAVDMRTGRALWSFAFRTSPRWLRELPKSGPDFPPFYILWPVTGGFLVARTDTGSFGELNYGELSAAGTLRWSARLAGVFSEPVFAPPYVFQVVSNTGGGFVAETSAFRLGSGGGLVSHVVNASAVLSVRAGTTVLRGDQAADVDQPFLSLDVLVADIAGGTVRARYRYQPDYEDNYGLVRAHLLEGSPGKAAVDGDALYFQIASKVFRYKLGPANGQRPLLESIDGELVGGPYLGWIFVARQDGVWALRPKGSSIQARLIAASNAAFRALTVYRRTVFVGFADGIVRGVDLESGKPVFAAHTCEPARVAIHQASVYVVCSSPQWSIVSFTR
ncbi:MAG TPA: PQQ-binding-like beta-propeller repeat protein [Candidatus Elarobacter sp.]